MSARAHSGASAHDAALTEAVLRRLRWRCRRGMRELDRLLEDRLDAIAIAGDAESLARFERLLDCEDDQLWRWCLGHQLPDDPALGREIDAIRTRHPA